MGRVKAFAEWLAEMVYISHWSDEEIMTNLKSQYPDIQQVGRVDWLRNQIQVIRENPDVYQSIFIRKEVKIENIE